MSGIDKVLENILIGSINMGWATEGQAATIRMAFAEANKSAAPSAASAVPQLPKPVDGERTLFEREMLRLDICDDEFMIRRHDGSYVDDCDQAAWMAWQAHAAIAASSSKTTLTYEQAINVVIAATEYAADIARSFPEDGPDAGSIKCADYITRLYAHKAGAALILAASGVKAT